MDVLDIQTVTPAPSVSCRCGIFLSNLRRHERPLPEDGLPGEEVPRGEDALPHVVADRVHDEPAALRRVRLLVVGGGHGSSTLLQFLRQQQDEFPRDVKQLVSGV